MATLVAIKNISRRRLRFGSTALPAAAPTGTGTVAYVDVDNPAVRKSLFKNFGSYVLAPDVLIAKVALAAANAGVNGGAFAWQNAEAASIFVHRVILDVTTPAPATATIDIGSTSTANGAADVTNLFNGQATSAAGTFISNNVAKLGATDWVSGTNKVVNATGLVGNVYIHYSLA